MLSTKAVTVQTQQYVGFDTITKQMEKRLLKQTFQLNLMVVGASGLGKSTFINTLFGSHLQETKLEGDVVAPEDVQLELKHSVYEMAENGVSLRLTLIDTPGFGDRVNNDRCWEPIVSFITDQYDLYMRKEMGPKREKKPTDTRVHGILYFIAPSGHELKPLDVEVLRKLSTIANVIPVIGKSDCLTVDERAEFKKRIKQELQLHEISLFPPLNSVEKLDDEELSLNESRMMPFAIVGSELMSDVAGKQARIRRYKWGVINVDDPLHCEFVHLRNFLMSVVFALGMTHQAVEERFSSLDPRADLYALLGLPALNAEEGKQCTAADIKKAYYKAALQCHPDKQTSASSLSEEEATCRFQQISVAYTVLGDPSKRALYDRLGDWQEALGRLPTSADGKQGDWDAYFRDMYGKVSLKDIEDYRVRYVGSQEEEEDLLAAYITSRGDMQRILEAVPFAEDAEEERYRLILQAKIEEGKVTHYRLFDKRMNAKMRQKRAREAAKEAKEAQAMAQQMGLDVEGGSTSEDQLALMIRTKHQKSMDDLLGRLEAKYCKSKPAKKTRK